LLHLVGDLFEMECCHKFYQNVIDVDVVSKTMLEKLFKKHCNMGVVVEEKKQ
jgi:hypothetical protein